LNLSLDNLLHLDYLLNLHFNNLFHFDLYFNNFFHLNLHNFLDLYYFFHNDFHYFLNRNLHHSVHKHFYNFFTLNLNNLLDRNGDFCYLLNSNRHLHDVLNIDGDLHLNYFLYLNYSFYHNLAYSLLLWWCLAIFHEFSSAGISLFLGILRVERLFR
jgi:hypothetical protein